MDGGLGCCLWGLSPSKARAGPSLQWKTANLELSRSRGIQLFN